MAEPLPLRFADHVAASGLLAGSPLVAVAFSGGGDSTALLDLLCRLQGGDWKLFAIHVAHGLRGAAGQADADFCGAFCLERTVPFVLVHVNVGRLRRPGESPEAAARRLRYAALRDAAEINGGALIATGHTRDDQAETVLLNLFRHAGRTRGGIRARRDDGVVRPLLPFGRAELREHLRSEGIPYREDETNTDPRFERNRIRHEVLPEIERRFPGATGRLARAGEALADRLARVDRDLDERLTTADAPLEGPWPRALFRELPVEAAGRLLVRAAGLFGRVPGRIQVAEAVAGLRGERPDLRSRLGGQRLLADGRAVRLIPS